MTRLFSQLGVVGALFCLMGCNELPHQGGGTSNAGGAPWINTMGVAGRSTGTTTPSTAGAGGSSSVTDELHPVSWVTGSVSLVADDFKLVVDGQRYFANTGNLRINSDPGWTEYTSLELTWYEHAREMRLFMYFSADGTEWWSNEIRTYDGQSPAEWIYYYGDFFQKPLGTAYTGDLVLKNNGDEDLYQGELTFRNLRLLPTFSTKPLVNY